jgi:hypothetical protein
MAFDTTDFESPDNGEGVSGTPTWVTILDLDLTAQAAWDFKVDGTSKAYTPTTGGTITLTAVNGGSSADFDTLLNASLSWNVSSTSVDFFTVTQTAPELTFDLSVVDAPPIPEERVRITVYGTPPPLVASATNPSLSVFRRLNSSTLCEVFRAVSGSGGWTNVGVLYPTVLSSSMNASDTDAPTWPRSYEFSATRGGWAYGAVSSGDLATQFTPVDADQVYGIAVRRGGATEAQSLTVITRIVAEALRAPS